jgi:hypothetical protein
MIVIAVASAALILVMLTFVGTSHRYTADFSAALFAAGMFGIALLDGLARAIRAISLAFASALTLFAFALTTGLAFHYQVDLVWGVPEELRDNFMRLRAYTDRWHPTP